MNTYTIAAIGLAAATSMAHAGQWVENPPDTPDASGRYIFYLHGSVEEHNGGSDKYDAAVEAIAEYDATVISEVRDITDPNAYAVRGINGVRLH